MNVLHFEDRVPEPWASALGAFESRFSYPLGSGRRFRISHGEDYLRFYRSMGPAACFIAERNGELLGVLTAVIRSLLLPNGREEDAAYLGDLKVAPAARGGRTLVSLGAAARQWALTRARAAFSVVMDGTLPAPDDYTGRLGLPAFAPLARLRILRIEGAGARPGPETGGGPASLDRFKALSRGRCRTVGGRPGERSGMEPLWLEIGGAACGRLEDTMKAKRLFLADGAELKSSHLSCFTFQSPQAGGDILRAALRAGSSRGFPAMFVSVPDQDAAGLMRGLDDCRSTVAPATVYGTGLEPGLDWHINTAEV